MEVRLNSKFEITNMANDENLKICDPDPERIFTIYSKARKTDFSNQELSHF